MERVFIAAGILDIQVGVKIIITVWITMMASYCCMVVFVLAIQPLYSLAVAPTDRHGICRTDYNYRQAHDWITYANDSSTNDTYSWKVLIDQYDYQSLVGNSIPPGVWSAIDVDGDGRQINQQGGGTCTYQLKANTYLNPNSNNWVFTQAVDYLDAVEVIVNATVRFSGCTDRQDCTNDYVILHRYDTNSLNEMQRINEANYQPYLGNTLSSRLQQGSGSGDTNIIERFLRPQNFNYTYFGLQDIGTTGTIKRIFVYYEVCPGKEEGLVIYPEIPYPPEGSSSPTTRTAQCVEHAHNVSKLETSVDSHGICNQTVNCMCDIGYAEQELIGQTKRQCIACDAGQYRSENNNSCVVCPANSTSTQASESCSCIQGHFRATNEGIGVDCKVPPSSISECTSNIVYDTGAVLQWRSPSHCGGRNDCYYLITINNGLPIRYDPTNFNFDVQETDTVSNLQPDTAYAITISVHNGVSEQDTDNAKLRECSVVVRTIPGSVFMLGDITYLNNTAAIIEDIGEEETNSLKCITPSETCCQTIRQGNFYYPNNDLVMIESRSESLYRTRNSGSISLNKRNDDSVPLGRYRCEIPDSRGNLQNLYITIGTIQLGPTTTLTTQCIETTCPTCVCEITPPTTSSTTEICPCPTTPPLKDDPIKFMFGGQAYPNNSVFLMSDIGESNTALSCVTDHVQCCQTSRTGEWFYPDNSLVLNLGAGTDFYRNRGSQTVRLNRRNNPLSPTGRYHCTIPDDTGTMQTLVANIIVEGTCLTPPTITCPTPSVCTTPEPVTTPIDTCPEISEDLNPLAFKLGDTTYPNNTIILLEEIGEEDSALLCVSNNTGCCTAPSDFKGEFYYPNGTTVPIDSMQHSVYRNRGSGFIRLNQRANAINPPPLGKYRCDILDDESVRQSLFINIVQNTSCPTDICTQAPSMSTCPTPSDMNCDDCPTAATQPCLTVTMDPTSEGIGFQFAGQRFPNNSVFLMSDIGESDTALSCVTDHVQCCQTSRTGEWFYPNNSLVLTLGAGMDFYRNRGSQTVRLNRRNNPLSPTGRYHCTIPDDTGTMQTLVANIIVEGTCPTPPTITCPTPSVCTTPGPVTTPIDTCPEISEDLNPLAFKLGDTTYPNNTIILLEEIGEEDSALLCVSNNTGCCSALSDFKGEFYYPNGTTVPIDSMQHSVYRNRGSGFIRLNQRANAINPPPLGKYRCDILDDVGVRQSLFINIVQNTSCPNDICTPTPPVSTCPTPSVMNCDDCPTATIQPCPTVTTCPTNEGISFQFAGQRFPNNSVFLMSDIGESDMALSCITDHVPCCQMSRTGDWFYPDNSLVPTSGMGMDFYRDRGSQTVRLNRRNSALSPTGRYHCTIPDDTGTMQTLVANIIVIGECPDTTSSPTPTCPTIAEAPTPDPNNRVVAVLDDVIVMDISAAVLSDIDKFEVKIFTVGEQRISKRQTKDLITFTVEGTGQPWVIIPSEHLTTLMKGSTYSVQIKPLFKNGTQGQYGPVFSFQFTGQVRDSASAVLTPESLVDMKFIALSIVLTFVITTIVVTLLVLVLVWLFLTCREKRSTKYNRKNGSDKPLELTNPYWDKNNN